MDCVCQPTLEQKVERLTKEKEATDHSFRIYFIAGSLSLLVVLVILSVLVFKLKLRTRKLKKNLELGSARYTSEQSELQDVKNPTDMAANPIYQVSLTYESGPKPKECALNSIKSKLNSTLASARSLFNYRAQLAGDETKLTTAEETPSTIYETIERRNNETAKKADSE